MEICNFMRFKRRNGVYTSWLAQNYFIGQSVSHNGQVYPYRPVAVATNSSTRGGDRSEAVIAAATSQLTLNIFSEAASNDWLLEVRSVKVNRVDQSIGVLLTVEYWATRQVQHDTSEPIVKLQLASPIDAVKSPGGRMLNQSLVGALPSSGALTLQ
jgi:hypothetical protein